IAAAARHGNDLASAVDGTSNVASDVLRLHPMARVTGVRGFSLTELPLVVALIAIVGAMAIPLVLNTTAQIRLSANARQVERELQTARMRAVRSHRAIRVRFNCPTTGEYRMVEVLGTVQTPAADDDDSRASVRCGYST